MGFGVDCGYYVEFGGIYEFVEVVKFSLSGDLGVEVGFFVGVGVFNVWCVGEFWGYDGGVVIWFGR